MQCHPILNPPQKDEGGKKIHINGEQRGVWGGSKESVIRVSSCLAFVKVFELDVKVVSHGVMNCNP